GLGVRAMGAALRSASVDHVIGSRAGLLAARAGRVPGTRFSTEALPTAPGGTPLPEVHAQMPAAVLFTSGATGPAKGVLYRHGQARAQVELVRTTYALGDDDRFVAAFAPFAILGPALGVASAVPAIDVTKPATLTAVALAEAAQAVQATVVFAAPAALRTVLATASALDAAGAGALATVRLLVSAGAPVPASLLRSLASVLPLAQCHTPYGMTECLPVTDVSLAQLEEAGPGDGVCVGWPLPGVELALSALSELGVADGELSTAPGVTGEICVRAEHMKDSYDALWATERAASRNPGWHRTGDVGHLDAEGRLWVSGRTLHVVSTAHGVLTPVGVEQRVEEVRSPAAVVGVGPVGTQQVVVVLAGGGDVLADAATTDAVRAAAGVDVAAVLVRKELPVDIRHSSKIDRVALARWAEGVLAGGRA
ncbi:MAG: AMP-binding protein, partial [Mycobacteriaceae bacterium]